MELEHESDHFLILKKNQCSCRFIWLCQPIKSLKSLSYESGRLVLKEHRKSDGVKVVHLLNTILQPVASISTTSLRGTTIRHPSVPLVSEGRGGEDTVGYCRGGIR